MHLDRVRFGGGPPGTARRWPERPGRHRSMLACLENPGDRGPAVRTGTDPRPVSGPELRGGRAQVDGAVALVAERQLSWGAIFVRNRRRAEAQREDISWLVHLSTLRKV